MQSSLQSSSNAGRGFDYVYPQMMSMSHRVTLLYIFARMSPSADHHYRHNGFQAVRFPTSTSEWT